MILLLVREEWHRGQSGLHPSNISRVSYAQRCWRHRWHEPTITLRSGHLVPLFFDTWHQVKRTIRVEEDYGWGENFQKVNLGGIVDIGHHMWLVFWGGRVVWLSAPDWNAYSPQEDAG